MNMSAIKKFLHALLLFCLVFPQFLAAQSPDQICASTTQIQNGCVSKPADTIASMLQTAKNPSQALDSTVRTWQVQGKMGQIIAQDILRILRAEVSAVESQNTLSNSQEKSKNELDLIALCVNQVSEMCKESQLAKQISGSSGAVTALNGATIICPPGDHLCNATGEVASQYCCPKGISCNLCSQITPTPQPPACAPPSKLVTIAIYRIPFDDTDDNGEPTSDDVAKAHCPTNPPSDPPRPTRTKTECRTFPPGDSPINEMCAQTIPRYDSDPTVTAGIYCVYFDKDHQGEHITPPRNLACRPFGLRDSPEVNRGDPNEPPIIPDEKPPVYRDIPIPAPIHQEF